MSSRLVRWRRPAAALAAIAIGALTSLVGVAHPAAAAPAFAQLTGGGSTWSYNAFSNWITDVHQYKMTVNYQGVGSTTGRVNFRDGTFDFAASDIPYGVKDGTSVDPAPTNRPFVYMPDTAGGTTFMYNLKIGTKRVTNLRLSGENIAKIFTGVLTKWNDPAIAADNPGLSLPAITIVPVVRSDGSGSTAQFTQWMVATQGSYWSAYCAKVGRNPCTQTSAYPLLNGSSIIGQSGDLGVSGYVKQDGAVGSIGYVEYSYALQNAFPVAKVLNSAGYYTEPTAGHVAVSLLKAQINNDVNNKDTYLTQDLSGVYTNSDPRTYELSSYSYMIMPTTNAFSFGNDKGYTLGEFGKFVLCQGQAQVDSEGYSALPVNLVEAGFNQLKNIPGANIPTATADIIKSCNNPTFSTDGTNTLAKNDPQPAACDKKGPTQCTTGTGGAAKTSTATGGAAGAAGAAAGTNGVPAAGASAGAGGGSGGAAGDAACDPSAGACTGGGGGGPDQVDAAAVNSPIGLGDAFEVFLMVLAAALLIGLAVGPPLISQLTTNRMQRRNTSGGAQ